MWRFAKINCTVWFVCVPREWTSGKHLILVPISQVFSPPLTLRSDVLLNDTDADTVDTRTRSTGNMSGQWRLPQGEPLPQHVCTNYTHPSLPRTDFSSSFSSSSSTSPTNRTDPKIRTHGSLTANLISHKSWAHSPERRLGLMLLGNGNTLVKFMYCVLMREKRPGGNGSAVVNRFPLKTLFCCKVL